MNKELSAGGLAIGAVGRIRRRPRLGGLLSYYDSRGVIVASTERWDITGSVRGRYDYGVGGGGSGASSIYPRVPSGRMGPGPNPR